MIAAAALVVVVVVVVEVMRGSIVDPNDTQSVGFLWTRDWLPLVSRWKWLVSFTPGKEPRYPLNRRLGWPQRRSGSFGEEKNILTLPEPDPESSRSLPSCI